MPTKRRPRIASRPPAPPEREQPRLPVQLPPPQFEGPARLLTKAEVVELTGRSWVTLWEWQQQGKFPRARDLNGRPVWWSPDIQAFLAGLPVRRIKGDPPDA
jgi:predicted DNA-binding transcriptional regulator AlpA